MPDRTEAASALEGIVGEPGGEIALRPAQTLVAADSPGLFVHKATEVADALVEIVRRKQLFKRIGTKDYPLVEAWTLLGSMMGAFGQAVFPVTIWTREYADPADGTMIGWEARVEAHTLQGQVVGAAEAMCTRRESRWRTADDYAIRSMAQTRATSKALRQPLGFIMQLAGLNATPAEEIDQEPQTPREATGSPRSAPKPRAAPDKGKLLARLRSGIEQLAGVPGWSEQEVLATATSLWGRPIATLDELEAEELVEIIASMKKHAGMSV